MGTGSVMRVRLLGPVDVVDGGDIRPVSGLRREAVLATLALHAGQVVGTGRLVDAVWGETAPAALNTLQSHISYLRTVLGKPAIVARAPGYPLDLGDDGTDVLLAERLHRRSGQDGPGGDLGAPGRHAVPRRAAVRRPTRLRPGRACARSWPGAARLLRGASGAAGADPASPG